jgi:hypothetical protein
VGASQCGAWVHPKAQCFFKILYRATLLAVSQKNSNEYSSNKKPLHQVGVVEGIPFSLLTNIN